MAGNRFNLHSKFQPKQRAKGYGGGGNDRVSQLPDEILIDIVSLLPLKQAACTSVLSSRWINLWKHTSCLDFDAKSALDKIAKQHELLGVERQKYVEWVNHVLRSHKADTLKEFRACFDLSQSSSESITRWLEFALARHVRKLELDLSAKFLTLSPRYYAFPEEFLTRSRAGASMSKSPSASDNFRSLQELYLQGVNLTCGTIESLLRMCPLLEILVVDLLKEEIWNLEVCGPSLVLKHLELLGGAGLKSVKISAPNLTTLIGPQVENILLENVPLLVKVSLNCMNNPDSVKNLVPTLSCCISQLEILTLKLDDIPKENVLSKFPELPKLKKLDISYLPTEESNLMALTPLIRASPCLQEFFLDTWSLETSRLDNEVRVPIQFPHHHLKMFQFHGYYGLPSDVELVKYIVENSVVLEKINVIMYASTRRDSVKQQLEALVPQNIKLAIY